MNSLTQTSTISSELETKLILPREAQYDLATGEFLAPEVLGTSFPLLIDNTARSAWVGCPEQFFRQAVQSVRGRGLPSIHLHAGGAFAKGLEVGRRAFYQHQQTQAQAEAAGLTALVEAYGTDTELDPARSGDKSLDGLIRAYESYMLEYPFGVTKLVPLQFPNGEVAVEFNFAIAIPETVHPETGDPILYGGRFDMVGVYNDQLFVVDEKTSTSLGERWARQWDLDSQFTGYCWAARGYGHLVAGAIIRGVGLLKTKTTHAEAIIYRPEWQVNRWLDQLIEEIGDMIKAWKRGRYKKTLDKKACDAYSGCPYKTLCETPEPDRWLSTHYHVVVWNPVAGK